MLHELFLFDDTNNVHVYTKFPACQINITLSILFQATTCVLPYERDNLQFLYHDVQEARGHT